MNRSGILPALVLAAATSRAAAEDRYSGSSVAARWSLCAYRAIFSPLLGHHTCNFNPTCSRFSTQAFERYGTVLGLLVTADRLERCNPYAALLYGSYYTGMTGERMNDPVQDHAPEPRPSSGQDAESPRTGTAVPPDLQQGSDQLRFADHLFRTGDYLRALGEYQRAAFLDSLETDRRCARMMIAESHYALGDFSAAARAFDEATTTFDYELTRYGLARSLLQLGRFTAARRYSDQIRDTALLRQATVVSALASFRQFDFRNGADRLSSSADSSVCAAASLARTRLPERGRFLGSALSTLVPGLGQVYAGRPGDGLYSFLIVGTCAAVSYYYWRNPDQDPGRVKLGIFAGLTLLFHAGNVYGANLAARDFNRLQKRNLLRRIETALSDVVLILDYRSLVRD
jgi:hypothetical protein